MTSLADRIRELIPYCPNLDDYDLDQRPESYWPTIPPFDPLAGLSDSECAELERRDPQMMGGRYLPPLGDWAEIARLQLKSTMADVISFRARRQGDRIEYAVVDEYSEDGKPFNFEASPSERPLSFGELIVFIATTNQDDYCEMEMESVIDFGKSSGESGYVSFTSPYYPALQGFFKAEDANWSESASPGESRPSFQDFAEGYERLMNDFTPELLAACRDELRHPEEFNQMDPEHMMILLIAGSILMLSDFDEMEEFLYLYKLFRSRGTVESAQKLYDVIGHSILLGTSSFESLTPFLYEELEDSIVRLAAFDMAMYMPAKPGEPLRGPKAILKAMKRGDVANVGAAYAGLLETGDRRVCKILFDARDLLAPNDQIQVAFNVAQVLHAPCLEFWVDWMEELATSKGDKRSIEAIAGGLVIQIGTLCSEGAELVFESERTFGGKLDESLTILDKWPIEEYLPRLIPRLQRIESSYRKMDMVKCLIKSCAFDQP